MIKRMSYRSWQWLLLTAFVVTLSSCQKEELGSIVEQETSFESEGLVKTVLGEKLKNPYSVTNMQKALENIKASNPNGRMASENLKIEATDYYVRFFPKTSEEFQRLEADSLNLYDYPLDYEIDSLGDYYVDPDVNMEEGKWYYTSVPVSYQFPDIEYEVLEELFLIEEDIESDNGRIASSDLLYDLEDEALRLTENRQELSKDKNSSNARRSKKNPQGYVRVYDTERRRLVGVENVRVRTRRWFSYGYAWTSSSGYYRINRGYRRDVHYTVFFENSLGFKIWSTTIDISKASHHVGKHSRYGRNIDMYTNSRAWRFSTVNNAVVKYRRFCSQLGVGLPASNLRIAATDKTGGSAAPMLRRTWGVFGFTSKSKLKEFLWRANGVSLSLNSIAIMLKFALPDLIIRAKSSLGTAKVYSVTFHELAHASHHNKAGNSYWVKYINYIITYGAYGNGTGNNAGVCGIGEMWGNYFGNVCRVREFGSSHRAFFDDDEDWYNPGFMRDVDNISDVTTAEIFSCLTSSTDTFNDLRNQLKTKTTNDVQVDNAWTNYSDWP